MVSRLPFKSLVNILNGKVTEPRKFVLKFYNNKCHLCRELHDTYVDLSTDPKNRDFYFYAFNIWDSPPKFFEAKMDFEGVPTICIINAKPGKTTFSVIKNPKKPDELTYYTQRYIQAFIDENRGIDD